jgi:DNA-binding MarR family transcriptional regulator
VSFPAWFEIHRDEVIAERPSAFRVYAFLLENPRALYEIQEPKAWFIAEQRKMSPDSVNEALDLLIERGYLIFHGRGQNNVRRVSVATIRAA